MDQRLTTLERRFKETNDPNDEAAWLKERLRHGVLDKADLELLCFMRHKPAAIALDNWIPHIPYPVDGDQKPIAPGAWTKTTKGAEMSSHYSPQHGFTAIQLRCLEFSAEEKISDTEKAMLNPRQIPPLVSDITGKLEMEVREKMALAGRMRITDFAQVFHSHWDSDKWLELAYHASMIGVEVWEKVMAKAQQGSRLLDLRGRQGGRTNDMLVNLDGMAVSDEELVEQRGQLLARRALREIAAVVYEGRKHTGIEVAFVINRFNDPGQMATLPQFLIRMIRLVQRILGERERTEDWSTPRYLTHILFEVRDLVTTWVRHAPGCTANIHKQVRCRCGLFPGDTYLLNRIRDRFVPRVHST